MATENLYLLNSYLTTFTASIKSITQNADHTYAVILDKTAFYPEGGGQPFDMGLLNSSEVINVYEENKQVIHLINKPLTESIVTGTINWQRRFDHMQQHTGQHILSAAFNELYGSNTVGFHLGQKSSQIDLDTFDLSNEDIIKAEKLANDIIFSNKDITSYILNDSSDLANFNLRKLPAKDFEALRLVKIADFDCCPCGGTHLKSTSEVGLIKIRSLEKKNNALRIDFVCGYRALEDYTLKHNLAQDLSRQLSSSIEDIDTNFKKTLVKYAENDKLIISLKNQLSLFKAQELYNSAPSYENFKIIKEIIPDCTSQDLALLAKNLTALPNSIVLLACNNEEKAHLLFSHCTTSLTLNMSQILKSVLPLINGRGGGNNTTAQGGGTNILKLDEALTSAFQAILEKINHH